MWSASWGWKHEKLRQLLQVTEAKHSKAEVIQGSPRLCQAFREGGDLISGIGFSFCLRKEKPHGFLIKYF